MKKRKWLIYTVILGLVPFLCRLLIFIIVKNVDAWFIVNAIDIISFGLILNITNINELESIESFNQSWKMTQIGLSLLLIIVFALFLGLAYLAEANPQSGLARNSITYCALGLNIPSIVFSYSIFNRINSTL